jgi:23S rRNA pseudouridine1911/1915/1917 synthase
MNEGADAPLVDLGCFKKWIIFEDDHLLVLSKPGWLVCHPSKNGPWSSLVGAAKEYLNVESIHLASRLDRETSGVVLIAKHRGAASKWQKGIEKKTVRRSYLTILEGEMYEENMVSNYLGKDPNSPVFVKQRVTGRSHKSQLAESKFVPLASSGGFTFALVATKTGRKHQIRVHAQSIGYPLVGEKLYGRDESYYLKFCEGGWKNEWFEDLGMARQALHGRSLGFVNQDEVFFADLAEDMVEFINLKFGLSDGDINALQFKADKFIRDQWKEELSCTDGVE